MANFDRICIAKYCVLPVIILFYAIVFVSNERMFSGFSGFFTLNHKKSIVAKIRSFVLEIRNL